MMSVSGSGLSQNDLCNLPIGSPIVTTALNDVTTVNTRVLADGTIALMSFFVVQWANTHTVSYALLANPKCMCVCGGGVQIINK